MNTRSHRFRLLDQLRRELDRVAIYVATAIFCLVAAAAYTGELSVPGRRAFLFAYPVALLAIDRLRPGSVVGRELQGAAALSILVIVAFRFTPTLLTFPDIVVGLPVAACTAAAVAAAPATAVILTMVLTGVVGSFQAFLGFSPSLLVDLMLGALWIVLLARVVLGRPYQFAAWPAILGFGLYFGITAIDLFTSDDFGVAWFGFHTTAWYMLVFVALAYAGWSRQTYRRIAIGFAAVTGLIAAYAVFRWVVGPAEVERVLATYSNRGINVDPLDKHLRTVGSFSTTHQMAFWMAFMAPFCAALALWLRGRLRLVPLGALVLCMLAMISSEARGPLVGFVVGVGLVLVLYQLSRAFPGFKAGVIAIAVGGLVAASAGALALGTSDPDDVGRYSRILDPTSDPTFIQREYKWGQILPEIRTQPFGHGLGTGGTASRSTRYLSFARFNIDNSYLKVAYEQGTIVMVLFIVALLALLARLAVASVRTRSTEAAAIGIGACGTLVSMLVSFYTGLYIEVLPILAGWMVVGVGLSYFVAREAKSVPAEAPVAETPRPREAQTRRPREPATI